MKTLSKINKQLVLGFLFLTFTCRLTCANENVYETVLRSTTWIVGSEMSGSGVLIDADRKLVVTNAHIVGNDSRLTVFFPIVLQGQIECDEEYYARHADKVGIIATVVAVDSIRDLALLELESIPKSATVIEFGTSARPGQIVHSIGNPDSSDALWIYTAGYVRANYFKKMADNRMQVVETSSPTNPGDSGGPIVDDSARLVGITQSYMTESRLVSNGVDISEIVWFVDKTLRTADTSASDNVNQPMSTENVASLSALFGATTKSENELAQKN